MIKISKKAAEQLGFSDKERDIYNEATKDNLNDYSLEEIVFIYSKRSELQTAALEKVIELDNNNE